MASTSEKMKNEIEIQMKGLVVVPLMGFAVSWKHLNLNLQEQRVLIQVGGLVAAAGVLGEIACPSDQGENIKVRILRFVDMVGNLSDLHLLCIGKEKSKEVVVLGGRIVGASSAMLILASVASLAF